MKPIYVEKWLPVVGWSDYEVSNLGRVRSLKKRPDGSPHARGEGGALAQRLTHNGYARVSLCRDGKMHHHLVHRLVLEAFVGSCPTGHEADHIDHDRVNNSLANLRWLSRAENRVRRAFWSTRGESNGQAKLTEAQVYEVRALRAQGLLQREIAAKLGMSKGAINHILNGRSWAHIAPKETP